MRFKVATNWDYRLIEEFKGTEVTSLYGKLNEDIVGGGRPSNRTKVITKEEAENYIKKTQDSGIDFNYLLNSACTGNMEFIPEYRKDMERYIDWIASTGAKQTTIALPFLIKMVHKKYPQIKISASSYTRIKSVQKAKYFEDMGVSELALDVSVNRNFELLKAMKDSLDCRLVLMVNNFCIYQCPYNACHANLNSHSSQIGKSTYKTYPYYLCQCYRKKYIEPDEMLKSPWIRPEDLEIYKEIGIDSFKIVGRVMPTEWNLNAVKAYLNRNYDGNFMDILNFAKGFIFSLKNVYGKYLELDQEMPTPKNSMDIPYIDNKKLHGFIRGVINRNCEKLDCEKCGYCFNKAKELVSIPDLEANKLRSKALDSVLTNIINGKVILGETYGV